MTDEIQESDEEVVLVEAERGQVAEPLETRIAELENQLADAEDEKLRAVADFQNYRRRSLQEAVNNRETATAALAEKLLPLLDNFSRTIAAAKTGADAQALIDGVQLMDQQLKAALEGVQVQQIQALGG
jgi:molecular chaperone GrpE